MKTLTRIPTLVCSIITLSAIASGASIASGIPGTGGVPVDVSDINVGSSVTVPNTLVRKSDTPTDKNGNPLFPVEVEAAAEEEAAASADAAFKAVVKAMKPREPVAALQGKRFSVYMSEKVLAAKYERNAKPETVKNGRLHVAALYSETRDLVVHGGLAVDADFPRSVRLSFGTRAYIALLETENNDVFATALGLEAAYNLPFDKLPLELAASLYYAPDILTFGAGDRGIDAQVDLAFPLRPTSSLFAGARFLQMDTRPEDREIDNRVHMGVRWDFM